MTVEGMMFLEQIELATFIRVFLLISGQNIIDQIKDRWNPTRERLSNKKLSVQTNYHSTLGEAISRNQRIYVIMHTELSDMSEPWLFWQHYVGYTWHSMSFIASRGCSALADKVAENCDKEAGKGMSLVRLDLYLTYGLCVDDLAGFCNKKIKSAAEKCRKNVRKHRKTVNFLVVDYADASPGKDVVQVAKMENLKNIKYY